MKRKYLVYGIVIFTLIIGYNALLIERDQKMFDAYYHHHSHTQQ